MIRRADATLRVADTEQAVAAVRDLIRRLDGFVSEQQLSRSDDRPWARLAVRVPAPRLDQAMESLRSLGEIDAERVTAEDVTEQYVDLDARIRNMESLEQRMRELLGQARTVEDAIRVEQELNKVRSELDSLQGRMRLLRNRVELATIELNVVQVIAAPRGSGARGWAGIGNRLWAALLRGGDNALSWTADALVLMAGVLPSLVVLAVAVAPAVWVWRRVRGARRARRARASEG